MLNKDWIDWNLILGSRTKLTVMVGIITFETRRLKTIFLYTKRKTYFVQPSMFKNDGQEKNSELFQT